MDLAGDVTGSTATVTVGIVTVDNGMERPTAGVTGFRKRSDREELARLKRLTGLDYDTVPVSLLAAQPDGTPADGTDTGAECRAEPLPRPARS